MSEIDAVRLESEVYPVVKIHAFGEIKNGGTPSSDEENWDGDIPFITPPDLNGLDSKSVASVGRTITELGLKQGSNLVENGVIISGRAPVGYVGVVVTPSAFNQGCKAICTAQNHRYVAYALTASKSNLQMLANGTTFSEISSTALANYAIPLPPLEIQRRIADYLDRETAEIDAAVADLDKYVELLEKRRSMITSDALTGADSVKLAHLVRFGNGQDWKDVATPDGEFPVYGSGGEFGRASNFLHDGEAILFGRKGTVDRPIYVDEKFWTVDTMYYAVPNKDKCLGKYIFYWATTIPFETITTNTALPSVTSMDLSQLYVPLPPLESQQRIADYLDRETAEIDSLIADSTKLRDLLLKRRSVLITEVVTGRKQV